MLGGQFGEDFAVELDFFNLEQIDELRVAQAVRPDCGVDADLPQGAVGPLLALTAAVGVDAGFDDSRLGQANDVLTAPAEAFGLLE